MGVAFDEISEGTETYGDQIRLMRAESAGKIIRSGSTHTIRDAADTKDRIVATATAQGRTPTSTDGT